jgi:DNA repair exonuclease SbcCD ATPase subunit
MIAQGDFLKLLLADTKDRQAIFRRIFETRYYQIFQDRLRKETGDLDDKCGDKKKSIRQYLQGIKCDDKSADDKSTDDRSAGETNEVLQRVKLAREGQMPTQDVLILLDALIREDEELQDTLCLTGSTNESVTLEISDLLYIEAVGNYVKVCQLRDGKVRTDMLRATSKQMEETLQPYPMIVRCHRAFLVNLQQVEQIVSHSGSMQLHIKHANDSIPVSRSNMAQVKMAIKRGQGEA